LYIGDVPGVGKTAIIDKVVRELILLSTDSDLPQFKYIFLDGMESTCKPIFVKICNKHKKKQDKKFFV
jgi:Cdc6-like AAA superfamily ATPase